MRTLFIKKEPGFTIIELLIVIAIVAILGAASASIYANFLVRNYLSNKTNELVSSLRTSQLNTISGKEGSQWGVKTTAAKIIMFKGTSYTGTPFDQSFNIPSSVTITQTEIVFSKLTGNPGGTATLTLSNNNGESNTVSVNQVGTVDVN